MFWHAGAGVQVPAGTVEDGESFEAAAVREAAEETGLTSLRLLTRLGTRTYDPPADRAFLVRQVALQTRPGREGPATSWSFRNVGVQVVERSDDYVRVVYEEADLDEGADPAGLVYARFEGWVPADALAWRQEREFFHFHADGLTPEHWQQRENDQHDFHLSWVRLQPRPGLLAAQQEWLDAFHAELLRGAEAQVGDSK